jgi:hypothetical protein
MADGAGATGLASPRPHTCGLHRVAPNIYYMGFAGVVRFGGLRIAGLSGIYDERDFVRGHYEAPPMDKRAVTRCRCSQAG